MAVLKKGAHMTERIDMMKRVGISICNSVWSYTKIIAAGICLLVCLVLIGLAFIGDFVCYGIGLLGQKICNVYNIIMEVDKKYVEPEK